MNASVNSGNFGSEQSRNRTYDDDGRREEPKRTQVSKEEKPNHKSKKPIKKNCLSSESREKLVAFIQKQLEKQKNKEQSLSQNLFSSIISNMQQNYSEYLDQKKLAPHAMYS